MKTGTFSAPFVATLAVFAVFVCLSSVNRRRRRRRRPRRNSEWLHAFVLVVSTLEPSVGAPVNTKWKGERRTRRAMRGGRDEGGEWSITLTLNVVVLAVSITVDKLHTYQRARVDTRKGRAGGIKRLRKRRSRRW